MAEVTAAMGGVDGHGIGIELLFEELERGVGRRSIDWGEDRVGKGEHRGRRGW